jgi:allantoinase
MKADLYLKNGLIVTEDTTFEGGVVVQQGRISQLVSGNVALDAEEIIDLQGKVVLPGLVDDHVHFNEPGREHWEGYRTGSMAAAAGGVTTVLEMPLNATPPTIDRSKLLRKREAARREAVVDYAHWGGLVDNNLDALDELNAEGVIGYKAFLSNTRTDFERIDDDLLYAGLLQTRTSGNVLGTHAENEYVTRLLGEQLQAVGRTDPAAWPESRPPFTELEAIQRAIYWARVSGGNLHIVHVTIAAGIRAAAQAKCEGVNVTVETCPHYLFFDHDDFVRIGPAAKCAPPIRSRDEVEALWECVLEDLVDTIASDHSPCPWSDKEPGFDNIWKAWGGISSIQSTLPVMLTEGVHKRGLPLPALARLMAANPARIFGLYPQKGTLRPGSDADLVVVDMDKEWTLSVDDLFYKNKHSAYVGCSFQGAVEQTIIRGVTVYRDGQITVEPGFGQLLRRGYPYRHVS